MNELNLLSARAILSSIYLKIKISLDEIKEKHPTRKDYIDSMEKSLSDLHEAKLVYDTLEKEYRAAISSQYRLEHQIMDLKFKIKDLELKSKSNNYEL